MYVLEDGGVKAECVVTDEGGGILELKNIAVEPGFQGRGYGKALVDFLIQTYAGRYVVLQVGTGDSPATIPFMRPAAFATSSGQKLFHRPLRPPHLRARGSTGGYGVSAKRAIEKGIHLPIEGDGSLFLTAFSVCLCIDVQAVAKGGRRRHLLKQLGSLGASWAFMTFLVNAIPTACWVLAIARSVDRAAIMPVSIEERSISILLVCIIFYSDGR